MFIRTFRKVQWYTPFILLLLGALFWGSSFLDPVSALDRIADDNAPFYELFLPWIINYPGISVAIAFVILMGQVFFVNHIAVSKGFTDRFSALPALLYLLLMSSTPGMTGPHPVLIANIFLLLGLNKIFKVYHESQAIMEVLNVGLLLAVAGLFYYPALPLLLLLIFALFLYFPVSLRTLLAALMGYIVPFFFLGVYYYMFDMLDEKLDTVSIAIQPLEIFRQSLDIYQQAFAVVLGLLSVFAFLRLQLLYMPDKPIRVRKRVMVLSLFFLLSVLTYLVTVDYIYVHHGILIIPLSIALAVFFSDLRKKKLAEIVFTILFLLILAGRFSAYFIF